MAQFVIPEDPEDEFSDDDWQEVLESLKPGGAAALSHEGCEDVLVGVIPANKVRSAARRILGYSIADDGSPYHLTRPDLPWQHPVFPWLWASGFTSQLYNPAGNPDNEDNKPYVPAIDIGPPDKTGNYTRAMVAIRFSRAPGEVLGDDDPLFDPGEEWGRFLQLDAMDPQLELILAEGGDQSSFYFAETSGAADGPKAGGPSATPTGTAFPGSVYVAKRQSRYTLLWRCVEESYVCDQDAPMPRPRRLINALGKVNSVPFIGSGGRKPGTLMLDAFHGRRYELPVRTANSTGLWAWDWYLTFLEFDPERGAPDPPSPGSPMYGHLLFPWRLDGKWYGATRGANAGQLSGTAALESTDFHSLFRHINNPSYP